MVFDIRYDPMAHLIRMVYWGEMTSRNVRGLALEVTKLIIEHKCFRVLSDLREADLNMSTFDVLGTPGIISHVLDSHGIRQDEVRRVYVAKVHLENFRLLETVSINVGHRVRVFTDIEEAVMWLAKE